MRARGRMRAQLASAGAVLALVVGAFVAFEPAPQPETFGGEPHLPARFLVRCGFTHRAPDDPIVAPGTVGGSHLHDFFGNFTVDTTSTLASLLGGDADCNRRTDRSGYWTPTLLQNGRAVVPVASRIYYGAGAKRADSVRTPPNGLVAVTGGTAAPRAVRWGCTGTDATTRTPRACGAEQLELSLRFGDCWDGTSLDAPDHRSHLAFAEQGVCPPGHPVPIPAIRFVVTYPVRGPAGLTFSSGGLETAHGDLFVAWHPETFHSLIERCINRRAC